MATMEATISKQNGKYYVNIDPADPAYDELTKNGRRGFRSLKAAREFATAHTEGRVPAEAV